VTPEWRPVRPTPEFFDDLDAQLGDDRGDHGEPSRHDFVTVELPDIMEKFATRWDDLPPFIAGRLDYRIMIEAGQQVPVYAVEAQLSPQGIIELVRLDLQLTWPHDPDDSDGEAEDE